MRWAQRWMSKRPSSGTESVSRIVGSARICQERSIAIVPASGSIRTEEAKRALAR